MKKLTILVGLVMALALALPGGTEAAALIEMKKLTDSDGRIFDNFGYSVAVSGDIAIVASSQEDGGVAFAGAAHVFQRDQGGADTWGEVKKLTASDGLALDFFGFSAAISGDTAVVGAVGNDSGTVVVGPPGTAGDNAGAAYIFQRDQGGPDNWGEVKKLTASDAEAFDEFGRSVAVSGDTVIVGDSAGAAYIFQRDQGGADNWGEVQKLTASDAQAGDGLGWSVALSGDTAVVGATGAAYVFGRGEGGADNWGEVKKLTASDAQAGDGFGWSVAVSGDSAVVGAIFKDAGGNEAGAAYVFQRDEGGAGNWGEVKKLIASDAQAGDQFGNSVAVSDDTAVVGAQEKDAAGDRAGAVYVFGRDQGGAGNWGEVKKLIASDAQAFDGFGRSVAVSDDTAVVGALGVQAVRIKAGAAYVFERKDTDGDTDGDGIPNSTDLDDDNDGCSDEQELSNDATLGGLRNPHNFWDFFDPNRDRAVGLLDFLAVLRHFGTSGDPSTLDPDGPEPPIGEYWASADRGGQAPGGDPWDELPANGSITFGDFLSVLRQFGHTCV